MIPDYEQRLDDLFCAAFACDKDNPAMCDWVDVKFELHALRKTESIISVVIDMNSRDVAEYHGPYDHAAVTEMLDNIDEMLEFVDEDIDKDVDWIDCNLVWERADPDDVSTTYLIIEYVGKHVWLDERGAEVCGT